MRTWKAIRDCLDTTPALAALKRLRTGQASQADKDLIGLILYDNYQDPYDLTFDKNRFIVSFFTDWNQEIDGYARSLHFKIKDIFED